MIQAYVDESGTHKGAKIVVMAGFLSSYKRWRKFEREWESVLNPAGQPRRVFHATDCLGVDGYRDFEGLSKDERSALVDRLAPIVEKRTISAFSCAFALSDYEEVVPERIRQKWKHPYYLCMFHIGQLIKVNQPRLPFKEKIGFVFGKTGGFEGLLTDLYGEMQGLTNLQDVLGKMTFGTPDEDTPLQASDLFCYLTRTLWEKERYTKGSAAFRTQALLRAVLGHPKKPLEPHFMDKRMLTAFAQAYEETHQEVGNWNWNPRNPSERRRL